MHKDIINKQKKLEKKIIKKNKSNFSQKIKNIFSIIIIKYFSFIIIFIVIIIFILGFIYMIKPEYRSIAESLSVSQKEKRQEYDESEKNLEKINNLIEIYEAVDPEDVNKVMAMLPKEKNHEELFTQMDSIISKNGFKLISLYFESNKESSNQSIRSKPGSNNSLLEENVDLPSEIGKIKVFLNIIGPDYNGLKRLLQVMENNLRILDIVNLKYDPADYVVDLEFYTYYYKGK